MRAILGMLAVGALAGALATASSGSGVRAAESTTHFVKVRDDFFKPKKVTIKKGDRVKWGWGKNGTDHKHTVTEQHGNWTSKEKRIGTYRHRFSKTGTFKVYCGTHPIDMRMKVVVEK